VSALLSSQASRSKIPPNRFVRAWRSDAIVADVVIATATLGVAWLFAAHDWLGFGGTLGSAKGQLYSLGCQILASVLGLLIAGAAIIAASSNLERLKVSSFRLYGALAKSLRDSMFCAVFALAAAFIGMIFDRGKSWTILEIAVLVFFGLVLLRLVRTIRRLYQTMLV
jgi:hypothetical protein